MLKDKSVLIVDDSRPVRRFLEALVSRLGMRAAMAETGAQALEAWRTGAFDLILLDLILPDIDGIQVLRTIREQDQTICIVLVTASGDVQTAIEAVRQGADGYIDKDDLLAPGQQEAFQDLLERSLSLREGLSARRELEMMRADLYAMITHDLRHPLHIIQTASVTLLDESLPLSQENRRELLQMIADSVNSLIHQLDEFLDYTKIDAGFLNLQLTEVNLAEVCATVVSRIEVLARGKHQTIRVNLPPDLPPVRADEQRVQQVLTNLLDNAVKYTPEGGQITLTAAADTTHVCVTITDTGIGISPDDLRRLFRRYGRGTGEKVRKIKGTGMGLLIAKQIIEAHGGKIWAESVEGQGSTFSFSLPRASAGKGAAGQVPSYMDAK